VRTKSRKTVSEQLLAKGFWRKAVSGRVSGRRVVI
jgi:hypothetical protein